MNRAAQIEKATGGISASSEWVEYHRGRLKQIVTLQRPRCQPTSCIKHAPSLGFVTQHPPGSNECYKASLQPYPCLCSFFISSVYPYACNCTNKILSSIVSTCLSLGSYTEVVSCAPLKGYTNSLDHNKLHTLCVSKCKLLSPETKHCITPYSMGLMR